MRSPTPRIAAIILAAGSSQRMNVRKQLIWIEGETLVRRAVRIALESEADFVVVALRRGDAAVQTELDGLDVQIAWVESPDLGQSESLRAGLEQAKEGGASAILVTPCDLPLLSVRHLNQLISNFKDSEAWIVASRYNEICGAPLILDDTLWDEVRALRGDIGARKILGQHSQKMMAVDWSDGSTDLDTPEDLDNFLGRIDRSL